MQLEGNNKATKWRKRKPKIENADNDLEKEKVGYVENQNAELMKNTEGKEEEKGGEKIKRANVSLSVFSFGPYRFPTFPVCKFPFSACTRCRGGFYSLSHFAFVGGSLF